MTFVEAHPGAWPLVLRVGPDAGIVHLAEDDRRVAGGPERPQPIEHRRAGARPPLIRAHREVAQQPDGLAAPRVRHRRGDDLAPRGGDEHRRARHLGFELLPRRELVVGEGGSEHRRVGARHELGVIATTRQHGDPEVSRGHARTVHR